MSSGDDASESHNRDPDGGADGSGAVTPPASDPWKGLRGVMAGTLILELIVVALAFPIVARVGGGLSWSSGLYLGLMCLLLFAGSGMQSRHWALTFDLGLQVLLVGGWIVHWSIGVIGVIFLMVWLYIAFVKRDVAARMAAGRLPGQRPPAP